MLPEEDLSIDLKRFSSGDSSPPITCRKVSLPSPSKSISSKMEAISSLKWFQIGFRPDEVLKSPTAVWYELAEERVWRKLEQMNFVLKDRRTEIFTPRALSELKRFGNTVCVVHSLICVYTDVWHPALVRTLSHCSLVSFPSFSLSAFPNVFLICQKQSLLLKLSQSYKCQCSPFSCI